MPIGPGFAYPPPPYTYRGVEDCFVVYEATKEAVDRLLPPGVEIADEQPTCIAWTRWVPFSTFGPFHESYIMVRVTFAGTTYLYPPFMFTDNEIPLCAGREIWGYAKKLAVMDRSWGGAPFGEQLMFAVQRPRGVPILTVTAACDSLSDPAALEALPILSTRLIPNSQANLPPSVAELVRLDVAPTPHRSDDGSYKLWEGRASVTFGTRTDVDPWHLLAPTRILKGYFGIFDFDLTRGTVVHDYLDDDIDWRT